MKRSLVVTYLSQKTKKRIGQTIEESLLTYGCIQFGLQEESFELSKRITFEISRLDRVNNDEIREHEGKSNCDRKRGKRGAQMV